MTRSVILLCLLLLTGRLGAEESWTLELVNLQGGARLYRTSVTVHSDGILYLGPPGSDDAVGKSVRLTPEMAAELRDAWLGVKPESLDEEYPSAIDYACGSDRRLVVLRQGQTARRWSLDFPGHSSYDVGVRRFLAGWRALLAGLPDGWASEFDPGIVRHVEPPLYRVDGLLLGSSYDKVCKRLGEPVHSYPLQRGKQARVVVWQDNLGYVYGTGSLQGLSGRVVEFDGRRIELGMTRQQVADILVGEAPASLSLNFDEQGRLKSLYAGLDEPCGGLRTIVETGSAK
ncbi:MAG: hypothetical protein KC910_10110 [Candidatus Eremiobacteraeota bacterium]|nr:hypothetical protein [Candidatus Eremiobacteraeota bacterium]